MSEGIPYVNSYRIKSVPNADPHWETKQAWKVCEQHIMNILGPLGVLVIMWMAHNVQYPGRKILWAPILVGVQGDGKTTLAKILAGAMGKANVGAVSPETMFSDFTGWAEQA
jgi:signal recognition particle GTPase